MSSRDRDDSPPANAPANARPNQVRAVIDDGVADGIYANVASIMSGPAEFFLDFGRVVPGRSDFRVHARVIMTPVHAKQLAIALTEHLRQFERSHGEIALPAPEDPTRRSGIH